MMEPWPGHPMPLTLLCMFGGLTSLAVPGSKASLSLHLWIIILLSSSLAEPGLPIALLSSSCRPSQSTREGGCFLLQSADPWMGPQQLFPGTVLGSMASFSGTSASLCVQERLSLSLGIT